MYKTCGVILRKYDIGEADRIYIVYAARYGKKELLVKGGRKIRSKLGNHLQEFTEIDLSFIKGKAWDKIIGAQVVKNYGQIKNDLRKITIGNFILDVVDNFIKYDFPDQEMYQLFLSVLDILEQETNIQKAYFSANIFIWKLLILLGYKPELNVCAGCGTRVLSDAFIDKRKAELICEQCSSAHKDLESAHLNSIEYLKGQIPKSIFMGEVSSIVHYFMHSHLEKTLKSEIWLNKFFSHNANT